MHKLSPTFRSISQFVLLVIGVVVLEWLVVHSAAFSRNPAPIAVGVQVDLLLGLPTLYYFLVVRRLTISPRTLLAVFGLSLGLTALILPASQHGVLELLRWSVQLAEFGFIGYVLLRSRAVVRQYRQRSRTLTDFSANLLSSLDAVLGPSLFNRVLVSELAVLRYGLFGWMIRIEKTDDDRVFTMHRSSGQIALTISLLLVVSIEMTLVHLLVVRWSALGAWLLTASEVYVLLFLLGDLFATIKRPVLVRANQVWLRFGLRGHGTLTKQQIAHVRSITDKPNRQADVLNGAFLTTPNVLLELTEPVQMTGPMGIQKAVRQIALFVDDKQPFINELTAQNQLN